MEQKVLVSELNVGYWIVLGLNVFLTEPFWCWRVVEPSEDGAGLLYSTDWVDARVAGRVFVLR